MKTTLRSLSIFIAFSHAALVQAQSESDPSENPEFNIVRTLLFQGSTGSNYISLAAPSLSSDTNYTLPASDGSANQVLTTNGSGALSWTSTSTGTVSTVGTLDTTPGAADGAVISGSDIILQEADASYPGLVSTGAQTFAGLKTFQDIDIQSGGQLRVNSSTTSAAIGADSEADTGGILLLRDTQASPAAGDSIITLRFNNSTDPSGAYFVRFSDSNTNPTGSIAAANSTTVSYNTSSDRRLKTDIQDFVGGLDMINDIRVRNYVWKENGQHASGFIAQELQEVYPEAVTGDPNGDVESEPMMIEYGRLTPVLVSAVQELSQQVADLKAEIETMKY